MKLRLNDNELRLRLSQSEVASFGESGRIAAEVKFASGILSYSLESAERASATFENGSIRIALPEAQVRHWIDCDETGIETTSGPLRILVEKDFACLHRDADENADAFPNPLAKTS
jgi:hypothetical protein